MSDTDATVLHLDEFGNDYRNARNQRCRLCQGSIVRGHGWRRVELAGVERVEHTAPLFMDECVDGAAKKQLRKMGFCIVPSSEGTADVDWLTLAGDNDYSVVTTDRRILENGLERDAILESRTRCFILTPQPTGTLETVRMFLTVWHKIRAEASFRGPAVWLLNYVSGKCTQVVPEPVAYQPIGFRNVPIGHMLNMFAALVKEYNEGWYSFAFVDAMHREIVAALNSRISGEPELDADPSDSKLSIRVEFDQPKIRVPIYEPFSLNDANYLLMEVGDYDTGYVYKKLIPAHKIFLEPYGSGDELDPDRSLPVYFRPEGFAEV